MPEKIHCVVGSGPAAVSCAKALLARGATVLLLDAGQQLEPERAAIVQSLAAQPPENWDAAALKKIQAHIPPGEKNLPDKLLFGSDFIYRGAEKWIPWRGENVDLKPSLALGGLGNVWGAAMLPYRDADITDWPIQNAQLAAHYEAVAKFTGLSGVADDLEEWFPLPKDVSPPARASRQAEMLLSNLQHHRERLRTRGWRFGRARVAIRGGDCRHCGQCMQGCVYDAIYNSAFTVREMSADKNFTLRTGVVVTRVEEAVDGVEISATDMASGQELKFSAARVYLAAGVIPTAQIVLRSRSLFDQAVWLKDSQYFLFPVLLARGAGDVRREALYTLSQAFIELQRPEISARTVHLQIYTYSELIGQALRRSFGPLAGALEPLARKLEERLVIVQGFLHSDDSRAIEMILRRENSGDRLHLRALDNVAPRPAIKRVVRELMKNFRALGGIPLSPQLQIPNPGRSFHNGGSFPMRANPGALETDIFGRLPGWEKIHIADASVLPTIPANTITFSAMANAHRIGWETAE